MKVLLGTDGSDLALLAEEVAAKLVPKEGTEFIVVSALVPPVPFSPLGPGAGGNAYATNYAELYEQLKAHTSKVASEAEARLKTRGFSVRVELREGDPGQELLDVADAFKADLVAIGSKGDNALTAMLLGSVARKLVSRSTCSVLVAHPHDNQEVRARVDQLRSRDKLRGVVAVEDPDSGQVLVDAIKRLAPQAFSHLEVVSADPPMYMPPSMEGMMFIPPMELDLDRIQTIARQGAEAFTGLASEVHGTGMSGRPANVILDVAEQQDADVIILSAKRYGAIERILIGSVSYEVAHAAARSVLIVRPPNDE